MSRSVAMSAPVLPCSRAGWSAEKRRDLVSVGSKRQARDLSNARRVIVVSRKSVAPADRQTLHQPAARQSSQIPFHATQLPQLD